MRRFSAAFALFVAATVGCGAWPAAAQSMQRTLSRSDSAAIAVAGGAGSGLPIGNTPDVVMSALAASNETCLGSGGTAFSTPYFGFLHAATAPQQDCIAAQRVKLLMGMRAATGDPRYQRWALNVLCRRIGGYAPVGMCPTAGWVPIASGYEWVDAAGTPHTARYWWDGAAWRWVHN